MIRGPAPDSIRWFVRAPDRPRAPSEQELVTVAPPRGHDAVGSHEAPYRHSGRPRLAAPTPAQAAVGR
jgi:hypothetical protein